MGQGLGHIQRRILEVLEELTRRSARDWFSLQFVTVFLYRQHQVDPKHERNRNRFGEFREDWTFSKNEHRRVWESTRALERKGLVECVIRKKDKKTWGGETRWMEIRIVKDKRN